MIPEMSFSMVVPEALSSVASVTRLHNRVSKEALRRELINHHKKRIPLHFDSNNRTRYGYAPRKEKYKYYKYKKFRSRTDLVLSGQTKQAMTRGGVTPRISGNSGGATGINGKLVLRFPFTGTNAFKQSRKKARLSGRTSRPRQAPGVTIDQMRAEVSVVLAGEQREMANNVAANYSQLLTEELKNRPKIRKLIQG